MTAAAVFEFERDAGERLAWLLTQRVAGSDASNAPNFDTSVKTAGRQLEWLKPSVLGQPNNNNANKHASARLYAGPAVMLKQGSVIIVLAHNARVMTIYLIPQGEQQQLALRELLDEVVGYAENTLPEK